MPTVPQYQQQVRESALPTARTQSFADTEAFGGGQSSQNANNAIVQYIAQEKQKADDIVTTEAYARATMAKNKLIYDPSDGLETKKGKSAIGALETYEKRFNDEMDSIEASLSNESQKNVFRSIREKQGLEFNTYVQKHVFTETKRYDTETTTAAVAAAMDDAVKNYRNPGTISENIRIQSAAIDAYGARNGLSEEIIQQQKAEAISKTHMGVIDRMINNNQDKMAKAYFDEVRGFMNGKDVSNVEKVLDAGSMLGESQRKEDEIMALGLSHQEALAMAREIEDPEMRDSVKKRIDSRYSELSEISRQQKEALFKQASDIAETTRRRPSPTIWAQLSITERNAIDSRIKQISEGNGTSSKTNWDTYYNLKTKASDNTDSFLKLNILQYRSQLGDSEFKELINLQSSLRKGDKKAEEQINGYRTTSQIVTDTLKQIGVDPNKGERQAIFKRRVDQEILEFKERNNRKPNTQEVQAIADNLVVKGEVKGRFWDTNKRLFEAEPGEVFFVSNISSIPRAEKLRIQDALKRNGKPITDSAVIELYNKKLQGRFNAN